MMELYKLSCHCLPVEILRYNTQNGKVQYTDRKDRTCNICSLNQIGDEKHYLLACENKSMKMLRQNFIETVKKHSPQLNNFSNENIMTYCISMKDENMQEITAQYINKLFQTFKLEDSLPPLKIICLRYFGELRNPKRRTYFNKKIRAGKGNQNR